MKAPKNNKNFASKKASLNLTCKNLLIGTLFVMLSTVAYSVPAPDEFVEIKQPNNSTVTVKVRGDERINWLESKEGYTLLRNDENYVVYATQNADGDLVPSNHKYYSTTQNAEQFQSVELQKELQKFLETTPKNLFYSNSQIETMMDVWQIKDNAIRKLKDELQYNVDVSGTRKYLVILMSYQDREFIKTREEYDAIFNQENYQGPGGFSSVRDYFIENSYGKFTPEFTVVGPYVASNNMAHYMTKGRDLAREAARAAFDDDVNFAQFDNTGNGYVDAITVIFAGYGRENGVANAIWSHASYITPNTPFFHGKHVARYACSPELRGSSGSTISGIGTACHEFAHALGAPDYYDVAFQNNQKTVKYEGAGRWCLMASGCHNGNGTRPSHINVFQKAVFNWVKPEVLGAASKTITMPNSAENPVAYRINTATNNEYFLLENRQRVGFDGNVPGTGLLIWRVHPSINPNVWEYNCSNCNHPQHLYPVCASSTFAIPNESPSSYGNINSAGCPFPGIANKTSFTDESIPSAKSWSGALTHRPITNITEENLLISFNYAGRPDVVFPIPYNYDFVNALHYSHYKVINASSDANRVWQRKQESGNWCASVRGFKGLTTELNNTWLITPAFNMKPGMVYTLTVAAKAKATTSPEALAIYIGNDTTIEAQKVRLLLDLPEITNTTYQNYSVEFSVHSDGFYYIGFHCYSGKDKDELFVSNIRIDHIVGIEDKEVVSSINIYPNPTGRNLIIENSENILINRVDISDISGKILISTEEQNIKSIDLSPLNSGTYWIIFHTLNGIEIKSIIKE